MKSRLSLAIAAVAALAAAPAEGALVGWSTASMYMHSGPARGYPVLAHVSPGTDLQVHGCVSGITWCDVSWREFRGWVPARLLDLTMEGRRVALVESGPVLGVPTVTFQQRSYWETNYTNYPFFAERQWWTAVPDVMSEEVRIYRRFDD